MRLVNEVIATALCGALLCSAGAGCRRTPSGPPEAKRELPRLGPPPPGYLPDGLRIEVAVDGRELPAIDTVRLRGTKPDFSSEDRRAWRLRALVEAPPQAPAQATFEVFGAAGERVHFPAVVSAEEPQPVLVVSRRGELSVTLLSPKNPFPAYHGDGRRMQRPGGNFPRVHRPARIVLHLGR